MVEQSVYFVIDTLLKPYNVLCYLFCAAVALILVAAVIGKKNRGRIACVLHTANDRESFLGRAVQATLLLITLISWCVMAVLLLFVLKIPETFLLRIAGYLIVYLLLPGYLMVRGIKKLYHASLLFALCGTCGMGIMFLAYLAATFTGKMSVVKYAPLPLALLSLVLFILDLRGRKLDRAYLRIDLQLLTLVSVLMTYVTFTRAVSASPTVDGSGYAFMDSLYVVSNSAAMKNGLLQDSLLFPGFYLRYHSMTNIMQACTGIVTGINAVELFMLYWPLIYLSIAVTAIHGLIAVLKKDTHGVGRMTALVIFSQIFTFGNLHLFDTNGISSNLYMGTANLEAYLLRLPNGNDIAIPMILCAAAVCILYYRDKCNLLAAFMLETLLIGMCTGAKAVYSLCIIGAMVGTAILLPFQRKGKTDIFKTLLLLHAAVLGFGVVYVLLIYNPNQSSVSTVSLFNPFDPRSSLKYESAYLWLKTALETFVPQIRFSDTAILLMEFPLSLFIILPYVIIPFFVGFFGELVQFKRVKPEQMLMYGTGICALLAYYLVNVDGYSQAYFLLAGICFIHIMGQLWLEENYGKMPFPAKSFVVLCLLVSLFSTAANMNQAVYTASMEAYTGLVQEADAPDPSYNSITRYEAEAMQWLKANSAEDSLIVTDRLLNGPRGDRTMLEAIDSALYFYYPAYSERQFYISGYSYSPRTEEMFQWIDQRLQVIEQLYNANSTGRGNLMVENGITHMVVSRFTTPTLDLSLDPTLCCIYSNRDIDVYVVGTYMEEDRR